MYKEVGPLDPAEEKVKIILFLAHLSLIALKFVGTLPGFAPPPLIAFSYSPLLTPASAYPLNTVVLKGSVLLAFSLHCVNFLRQSSFLWLQVSHLHKQSFNPHHQLQPEWDREGGREGDARGKRYGNICICIIDSLCYKAETNTPL